MFCAFTLFFFSAKDTNVVKWTGQFGTGFSSGSGSQIKNSYGVRLEISPSTLGMGNAGKFSELALTKRVS